MQAASISRHACGGNREWPLQQRVPRALTDVRKCLRARQEVGGAGSLGTLDALDAAGQGALRRMRSVSGLDAAVPGCIVGHSSEQRRE